MRRKLAAAALALPALGCAAPVAWEKPGADDEQRALDLAECASFARGELRREAVPAPEGTAPDAATIGRNEDAAVARRLQEADAGRLREELIARCMTAKGYEPAREAGG